MSDNDILFRRLFPAPDNPYELLATSNKSCVVMIRCEDSNQEVPFVVPDTDTTPRVRLPFPARSISWYPLRSKTDNASFLTACQTQPLQLWDLEDGAQRASYVAFNDSGNNADPQCTLWIGKPHTGLIAGGYGGFEDKHHVRLYDVLYEGDNAVLKYRSRVGSAVGGTCTLSNGPSQLVLASYFKSDVVEAIDIRSGTLSLFLRGMSGSGAACIRSHPSDEYLVYVSGYKGSKFIYKWDLRQCAEPLSLFHREAGTSQICDFAFAKATAQNSSSAEWSLTSSTSAGGLLVFPDEAGTDFKGAQHGCHRFKDQLGPTGGLAALPDGRLVVAFGSRSYSFKKRTSEKPPPVVQEIPSLSMKPPVRAGLLDEKSDDATTQLTYPIGHGHLHTHVSDTDSEDSFYQRGWCAGRKEGSYLHAAIVHL
ncbi:unnamed protein product [Phytomonas sp. Hart1]|nr:unnamed protein product [Phytomonas sp. Hart1]|eukprot:CCW68438.1 unnamed protein product [Phytomonas sp. isolate Hart1]